MVQQLYSDSQFFLIGRDNCSWPLFSIIDDNVRSHRMLAQAPKRKP